MKIQAYTLQHIAFYLFISTLLINTSYPYVHSIHQDMMCLKSFIKQTQYKNLNYCNLRPSSNSLFKVDVHQKKDRCYVRIHPKPNCYSFYNRYLKSQKLPKKIKINL